MLVLASGCQGRSLMDNGIDGGGNSDGSSGSGGGGSSDSGNFDGNSGDSRDSRFNGDSRDSFSNSGGGGRGSGEQIPGECSHSENGESYSDSRLGCNFCSGNSLICNRGGRSYEDGYADCIFYRADRSEVNFRCPLRDRSLKCDWDSIHPRFTNDDGGCGYSSTHSLLSEWAPSF
ncbi:hypothetical protein ACKKBG_A19895 [Auxenochlorella protothecoides x Auxenochlorella symbiontica]